MGRVQPSADWSSAQQADKAAASGSPASQADKATGRHPAPRAPTGPSRPCHLSSTPGSFRAPGYGPNQRSRPLPSLPATKTAAPRTGTERGQDRIASRPRDAIVRHQHHFSDKTHADMDAPLDQLAGGQLDRDQVPMFLHHPTCQVLGRPLARTWYHRMPSYLASLDAIVGTQS